MPEPTPTAPRADVAKSVVFSLRTLEEVAASQPVTLGALSRAIPAPKTTVLRSLRALAAAGYVYQDAAGAGWSLTLRCLRLAQAATEILGLTEAAMPVMKDLSLTTEETVSLGVLEGDAVVVVEKVDGRKAVRAYTERGRSPPVHASSSGKVILAGMPTPELERCLAGPLERFTATTITDPAELRVELDRIRAVGYSTNNGERSADVFGMAAPVRDASGRIVAAISITLPRQHADAVADDIAGHCVAAADEISTRLGFSR